MLVILIFVNVLHLTRYLGSCRNFESAILNWRLGPLIIVRWRAQHPAILEGGTACPQGESEHWSSDQIEKRYAG